MASTSPSSRRAGGPGQTWSDAETSHLISAYARKWYSLNRGPLKAQQWEEVAADVAARCGLRVPSRNGTQCRHKMEKLRKRYRAERKNPSPDPWLHFRQMDRMEGGTLGASDEDEDEDPAGPSNGSAGAGWGNRAPRAPPRGAAAAAAADGGLAVHLAASLTRFAEEFQIVETKRMEMMANLERDWMDMERRRMEMLMDSQQYIVDAVVDAMVASYHPLKRARTSP